MKKVFLGGTCNDSKWRDQLISKLNIDYFNPVVEDWTAECMIEELRQREICDYVLYVITPKMSGVYSIAEVVDDSNKRPSKTLFCILWTDDKSVFDKGQMKSLMQVKAMVNKNEAMVFDGLDEIAEYLNNQE